MEHNIAFCVSTYNHPDTVEEVLGHTVEMYDRYGIDIYYYDSSETDETKVLVEGYIENNAKNLYYIYTKPYVTDAYKSLYLLSGSALKKHYDYIFMIKDGSYFDEATIKRLHEIAQTRYDAILMPPSHWPLDVYPQPDTEVYTDPVEFFRDYGVHTPNWEVLLLNYDTMLKNMNWKAFVEKYYKEDRCPFLQMVLLFTGLASLDNPKARVMRESEVNRCLSTLSTSLWEKNTFDVWVARWITAVDMLPECYDKYKSYVKKKETMQPSLFGSPYQLMYFAKKKYLTKVIAEQIKDVWAELSDIPYECLEYIFDDRNVLLMERLMTEWVGLFNEQRFSQAYQMFHTNYWFKEFYGRYIYDTLEKCFEIYKNELAHGKDEGIFANVYSVDDVVNKYQTVKYMLRRLEYEVSYDITDDIIPYFVEQQVTVECLSYIIQTECEDTEKVTNYWELLYKAYKIKVYGR